MTKKDKFNISSAINYLIAALLIIFLINIYLLSSTNSQLNKLVKDAELANMPAELDITLITENCDECFDAQQIIDLIKQGNAVIKSETALKINSAKDLIEQYQIERLPAVIIKGDLQQFETHFAQLAQSIDKAADAYVFKTAPAPYIDAKTGDKKGVVTLTYIKDSSCKECIDLEPFFGQFETLGVYIGKPIEADINSVQGKSLAEKYSITKVPTIIMSSDVEEYSAITDVWDKVGTVEEDGTYVMRTLTPPYKELTTGKIKGLVKVTYITDNSCKECYDVNFHKTIIQQMGITPVSEKTVDIGTPEGANLLAKYSITKVPTIILSEDAKEYSAVKQIWPQVGTVEKDGTHVFRNIELLKDKVFNNLETGEVKSGEIAAEE